LRRREFITLLGAWAAAWPLAARAQQVSAAKVGLLWPGAGPPVSPRMESFREGLRRSGYVEGQNVTIELRYAQPGQEQLAGQAADLVRANVDVIATFGDGGTKIAQGATSTIPIVTIGDDLLGSGLIGSLSRPGANTTGITILGPELGAKRLELLSTITPGLSRVAILWDPISGPSQVAMSENAARTMKLKLQILEVAHRDDLDGAFRAARDGQAQAVNVFSSPFLASLYREIIDRAAEYRLPAIYQWRGTCRSRRSDVLRTQPSRDVGARWCNGGEDPQRYKAFRYARRTANQIRIGHQSKDRESTRSYSLSRFSADC
jgi:putative tryptophan/tyrosine transport system substrate-binding protein